MTKNHIVLPESSDTQYFVYLQVKHLSVLHITTIVKKHLAERGIKQIELADKTGISKQMVNHWLKKNDLPTDVLVKFSKALNHDFFAEMSMEMRKEMGVGGTVQEPGALYLGKNEKYVSALEQLVELQRKYDALLLENEQLKKQNKKIYT